MHQSSKWSREHLEEGFAIDHTHNAEYENRGLTNVFFAGDVTLATSVASTAPTPTPGKSHLRTYKFENGI
jgi:hypothetical protein